MSFKKLLLQNDMKKPKIKQKNGKRTIYVNYNEKVFDAKSLEELRKEINYICENNTEPISIENSNIRILLNTEYFKDRTFFHFIERQKQKRYDLYSEIPLRPDSAAQWSGPKRFRSRSLRACLSGSGRFLPWGRGSRYCLQPVQYARLLPGHECG